MLTSNTKQNTEPLKTNPANVHHCQPIKRIFPSRGAVEKFSLFFIKKRCKGLLLMKNPMRFSNVSRHRPPFCRVGGLRSEDPPKNCGKLRENRGKLRFLVREIAVGTQKNFSFPDSGQEKGCQKITSPNRVKAQQKNISHIWVKQF